MNGERAFQKMRALMRDPEGQQRRMDELLARIKAGLADIDALLAEYRDEWAEEDGIYRFYHQSFKVFGRLQPLLWGLSSVDCGRSGYFIFLMRRSRDICGDAQSVHRGLTRISRRTLPCKALVTQPRNA